MSVLIIQLPLSITDDGNGQPDIFQQFDQYYTHRNNEEIKGNDSVNDPRKGLALVPDRPWQSHRNPHQENIYLDPQTITFDP